MVDNGGCVDVAAMMRHRWCGAQRCPTVPDGARRCLGGLVNGQVKASLAEARRGRTPNPDVLCNSRVKFGAFFDSVGSGRFSKVSTQALKRARTSTLTQLTRTHAHAHTRAQTHAHTHTHANATRAAHARKQGTH